MPPSLLHEKCSEIKTKPRRNTASVTEGLQKETGEARNDPPPEQRGHQLEKTTGTRHLMENGGWRIGNQVSKALPLRLWG